MYPTASAPQYAFGPGLAPVPMPGMAGGGLAALANQYRKGGRIRYFEDGGDAGDGGDSPSGSDSPSDDNSGGGGGSSSDSPAADPGAAAQAAAQGVDNAVEAAQDVAEATLGAQVAAEEQEAQATQAAENMANLQAQADAVAAEIAANQEEDAKAAEMAAVMAGQVPGFPGPQAQASKGYNATFQNPLSLNKPFFGITDPFVSIDVPFMNQPIEMTPFGVAAPALGKGAQAVSAGIAAGKALGFAEGGLAAAQQTQSRGRGQDTMLVHMTPGEVKGLQALAMSQGGSLTINPQTGLPEAGFLSRMLPMIAGMALAPLTAGTSLAFLGATPFASALTVGGLTGLATGSLKKGLMAGLGAYGGAGIGQGLSAAAGTAENLANVATPIDAAVTPDLLTTYGPTPTPLGIGSEGASMSTGAFNPSIGSEGASMSTSDFLKPSIKDTTYAQLPPPPPTPVTGMDAFTGGTKAMLQTGYPGEVARSAFMNATPVGSLTAAGTTVASALTPEPEPLKTSPTYIRPYKLDITNPSGTPQYTPQDTREREQVRYAYSPQPIYQAAQGGLAALNGQTYDDEYGRDEYEEGGSVKKRKFRSLKGEPYYKFADSRRNQSMEAAIEQNFAKGGLGAALPPRFLSGGGDGMSDSIKANIDGKQEARLADGEFVVPADVVSHLGNGSSKAGAKKLYAMMDKIRKARTGRTRQAPEVNAQKYMPA